MDIAGLLGLVTSVSLVYFRWKDHRRSVDIEINTRKSKPVHATEVPGEYVYRVYVVNRSQNPVWIHGLTLQSPPGELPRKRPFRKHRDDSAEPTIIYRNFSTQVGPGDSEKCLILRYHLAETLTHHFGLNGEAKIRVVVTDEELREHKSRWVTLDVDETLGEPKPLVVGKQRRLQVADD